MNLDGNIEGIEIPMFFHQLKTRNPDAFERILRIPPSFRSEPSGCMAVISLPTDESIHLNSKVELELEHIEMNRRRDIMIKEAKEAKEIKVMKKDTEKVSERVKVRRERKARKNIRKLGYGNETSSATANSSLSVGVNSMQSSGSGSKEKNKDTTVSSHVLTGDKNIDVDADGDMSVIPVLMVDSRYLGPGSDLRKEFAKKLFSEVDEKWENGNCEAKIRWHRASLRSALYSLLPWFVKKKDDGIF